MPVGIVVYCKLHALSICLLMLSLILEICFTESTFLIEILNSGLALVHMRPHLNIMTFNAWYYGQYP